MLLADVQLVGDTLRIEALCCGWFASARRRMDRGAFE
jgi:hypothetical protein